MDTNERDATVPLSEQAARWWVTLNDGSAGACDRQAFGEWVARSPERVEAYLRAVRLLGALRSRRAHWPDVPAEVLIREARAVSAEVTSLGRAPRPPAGAGSRHRLLLGLAAALLVTIAAAWMFLGSPQHYYTALGEQRSVVLGDGSLVTLNTSSRIEVDLDRERRLIRLLAGEALFQVAQDAHRPFEVLAGGTTIRAVGTQFNVDRRAARTTVTVLEGRVIVAGEDAARSPGAYLDAAERIVVTAAGVGAPEAVANVTPVTAWTQRRLIFERRPLGEVAGEFNRYNRRHIRIDDAALARQRVTGVFQANDPASFVVFLEKIPGVEVRETSDATRVTQR